MGSVLAMKGPNPVEKVVTLLQELQAKVVVEGKAEAKTYDAFACFCKDTSKSKSDAIAENEATKESLLGSLAEEESNRDTADKKIADTTAELESLSKELAELEKQNRKDKEHYDFEIQDIGAAVDSLERAITALKASDKDENAFLQMQGTLKQAVLLADTLGLISKDSSRQALIQVAQPEGVPTSDYDFHSHGIIEILEGLLVDFRETRTRTNDDETKRIAKYNGEKQANHDATKAAKKELADAQAAQSQAREKIGAHQTDITLTQAALDDDQSYLLDLTDKCNQKKALWDQRSAMRQDELTALTQALTIIQDSVSEHAERRSGQNKESKMLDLNQEPAQFVQIRKSVRQMKEVATKGFLSSRNPREMVLNLLKSKAASLKSVALSALAARVGADPLAKVKKLIEELILRLQEEAKQEESHHGWCTEQTNLAKDKRSRNAEKVTTLNGELAELEVKRDKIFETLEKLENEIAELEADYKKTKGIHEDETAERDQAIADAKAGHEAVTSATKVLKEFYESAKPSESLLQGPADDLPDAGFDEEYYGSQDTATGIFGMLEVITSDFQRTIDESTAAQKEADKLFFDFEKKTNMSLDEKNILHDDFTSQKTNTLDSIQNKNKDLDDGMAAVDSAVTELIELHAACIAGGMTYEERVAKREEEIEALKQAYEILDNYSE